jgi:hypothetical protein
VKNNQLIKGLIFKEVPGKKWSTSPLEMEERGCIILFIYFYSGIGAKGVDFESQRVVDW